MKKFYILYISRIILIAISLIFLLPPNKIYASKEGGVERIRNCSATTGEIEGFDAFTPLNTVISREMDFNLTNPVCITVAATAYGVIKGAITHMNGICNNNFIIIYVISKPKNFKTMEFPNFKNYFIYVNYMYLLYLRIYSYL